MLKLHDRKIICRKYDYQENKCQFAYSFATLFFFRTCAEVCAGSFVWRYRKNLPLKINFSYMYWYKIVYFDVELITLFLYIPGKHIPIYCRFLFVTLVIMCVQTCLTYQIKVEIPVYLNIIVSNCISSRKIIIFFIKVKNE